MKNSWLLAISLIASVAAAAASNDVGKKIALAAQQCAGKQMWKGYGLADGRLGCAAALCNVLKAAGISSAHSAGVVQVRRQLLLDKTQAQELIVRNGPGEELDDAKLNAVAQPGDIVLAFTKPPTNPNGGPDAHCGILATPTEIFTNDWNDGIWKKVNIHLMFDYYPYLRLVRIGKL